MYETTPQTYLIDRMRTTTRTRSASSTAIALLMPHCYGWRHELFRVHGRRQWRRFPGALPPPPILGLRAAAVLLRQGVAKALAGLFARQEVAHVPPGAVALAPSDETAAILPTGRLQVVSATPPANLCDNFRDDLSLLDFGRGGGVRGELRQDGLAVRPIARRVLAGAAPSAPHVVRTRLEIGRQRRLTVGGRRLFVVAAVFC